MKRKKRKGNIYIYTYGRSFSILNTCLQGVNVVFLRLCILQVYHTKNLNEIYIDIYGWYMLIYICISYIKNAILQYL